MFEFFFSLHARMCFHEIVRKSSRFYQFWNEFSIRLVFENDINLFENKKIEDQNSAPKKYIMESAWCDKYTFYFIFSRI